MAHVTKFKKSAIGNLCNHYERGEDSQELKMRKNEKINSTKTYMNYNLAQQDQPLEQIDFIKKRLSEVKVQNRKDLNVMCDWVVTKPQDLKENQQKEFFQETYNFLKEKYGKDNIISSYVHLDESTPHMHFAFIPVTEDKKHDRLKVSAKEVINRASLKTFHQELENHLKEKNIVCSILNDATKEGNKSIDELKKAERLNELKHIEIEINKAKLNLSGIKDMQQSTKVKSKQLEEFKVVKESKNLLGGIKPVDWNEYMRVVSLHKKLRSEYLKAINKNNELVVQNEISNSRIKNLENIIALENTKPDFQRISKLKNENYILQKKIKPYIEDLKNNIKNKDSEIELLENNLKKISSNEKIFNSSLLKACNELIKNSPTKEQGYNQFFKKVMEIEKDSENKIKAIEKMFKYTSMEKDAFKSLNNMKEDLNIPLNVQNAILKLCKKLDKSNDFEMTR